MVEELLREFGKGFGRFFIQPQLYVFIGAAFLLGFARVKRERKDFHTRVFDVVADIKALFHGVWFGLGLSIITVALGLVIPFGVLILLAAVTSLLAIAGQMKWLSPAYILGLFLTAALLISEVETPYAFLNQIIEDVASADLAGLALLMGLLIFLEGLLITYRGAAYSSPSLKRSKRGKIIGSHKAKRLWLLPVFLLVPGDAIQSTFEWWPVLTIADSSFSVWAVPFAIGFSQRVQGSLPIESIRISGRRVSALGIIVTAVAAGSLFFPLLVLAAIATAVLGREFLNMRQRYNDDQNTTYFSKRDHGLVILGVLPKSPAQKIGLQVGEIITKVNGLHVHTEKEFYEALQENLAFCKLEVLDFNGEVRIVQRALYDSEHYELGLLFVHDNNEWHREHVAL